MKKHGRTRFLNGIFIVLVGTQAFAVLYPIGISGQTVQQKQDAVQLAAHVWLQPADTRVSGMTPRRLWATAAAVLGLIGVVIGGLALRPGRIGNGRLGAILSLVMGLVALVNGGLNLAVAKGGPGSGSGILGGVVALVLGLIAMALGGLALARTRRTGVT
jgi:hypothetical protein